MTGLARIAIQNPLLANLIMVAIAGIGMYSLATLPQEQMPDVSFPWAFVVVPDPGVAPEEMEKVVTMELEEQLKGLDDLNSMTSISREGMSFVWLKFDTMPDDEFKLRLQDVRAAVNRVKLPASAEDPQITQFKTQDFAPLISVILRGDLPEHQLKIIADDLREDILDIDKVSQVQITGIREREVWVEVDPARLERYGLSMSQVADAIRAKHLNLTGGDLQTGRMDFRVRTVGEATEIPDLGSVIVRASAGGGHVRVADVAEVRDTFQDRTSISHFDGKPAATLTVAKKQDGNSIRIIEAIKELGLEYSETRLPPSAELLYTNDSSVFINDILGTLKSNAWIGMLLVAVCLFLFLGWRQAAFAVIGIPIALAMTFTFLRFTGNTINSSTLFGLVLVLGMLVDDAVVVIENCFRYIQHGLPARQAAMIGTREVILPVMTSAGTTMAAFLPLMLLPGVIGDFMRIIPIVVSLALIASLFESFYILPAHIAEWSGRLRKGQAARPPVGFGPVRRWYRRRLAWVIRRRYLVLIVTTVVIVVSFGAIIGALGVDMFADEEIPFFFVYLTMPDGTRIEATDATLARMEALALSDLPPGEIKHVVRSAGYQETDAEWIMRSSVGQLMVELHPKNDREHGVDDLINRFRDAVAAVPGVEALEFKRISSGPPTGAPIEVKVRGDDLAQLQIVVDEVETLLRSTPGIKDVRDNFVTAIPELRVRVNEERAAMHGLTVAQVAGEVYSAFNGTVATEFLDGDDDIDVVVRLAEAYRKDTDELGGLRVVAPDGSRLLLKDLAEIREAPGLATIHRDDNRRAITVTANVDSEVITGVRANEVLVEAWPAIAARYPGHDIKFGGEFQEFQEAFTNLGLLFLVGILLMLILMVAQFSSLTQPLIIFAAVLFAFWGAVMGLFLINSPFSINNLFGLVALAGVAVNNSIVLIAFINRMRERGASRMRSVMRAGVLRVRPILLTSVTTVVGLIPMAIGLGGYSEVWGPLATVMVCGLTASSILSLFLIPCLYLVLGDTKRLVTRRGVRDETAAKKQWTERIKRRKELADA